MPFSNKSDLMIDLTGRIVFASTSFCDLVGIDYDKVEGKSCFDFFFSEDIHEATKLLKKNPNNGRFRLRHNDGEAVWVDIRGLEQLQNDGPFAISAKVSAANGDG